MAAPALPFSDDAEESAPDFPAETCGTVARTVHIE
jgi:hypothetical protein